jgi:hypothetical protein
MNIQSSSSDPSDDARYIYFYSDGAQTWSLENICMNMTSDSNQVKIKDETWGSGSVTYTKKVNVGNSCPYEYFQATGTPELPRPTSPASTTHE